MLSRLLLVFLFVVQTNSLSVLTDDKSQTTKTDGETVLVRQLLNQETLIRMALDRKVNDLVKGIADLKKNMETSNQQLQDAKREIETNIQQLQDARREIETNDQQLQDAKREIETNNQQLHDAKREIETNNHQLQDAKREIETNNQQLQDAKREIETNNQQLQDAKREIETNNKQLQDAKREIETNNQQLQDAKREIETNDKQLQDAKREIETNNQQLQDAKREIETNNQQLQDAKREIKTNNQQLQDAKREIETNNQQLQDAKREIETNNKQFQDAKREIQTNKQQLQDAKKEIAALKNENSVLKAKWQVQSNLTTLLSDNLTTTINTVKESQLSQRELSSAVSSLQAFQKNMSLGAVKDTPVAFTAGLTSYSYSWRGDILVFPHVITNKGQGYSSNAGKFTAPRDGTYVFTVTGVSWSSNGLTLEIVHDGVSKVRTYSSSSDSYQTGTNLVVLELDRGDAVWVRRHGGQGYYTDFVPMTTFSGFIL